MGEFHIPSFLYGVTLATFWTWIAVKVRRSK
jgi:hypothetical protein